MVEGARLESVYTRKGIEGSNPSLSAYKALFILEQEEKILCVYPSEPEGFFFLCRSVQRS